MDWYKTNKDQSNLFDHPELTFQPLDLTFPYQYRVNYLKPPSY